MSRLVHAAVISAKGQTTAHNNDAYYFNGTYAGLAQMDRFASFSDVFPAGNCVFAVCDGPDDGGAGAMAAYTVASALTEYRQSVAAQDFSKHTEAWLRNMNFELMASEARSSTTLALACVTARCVYMAQIGDSRIYRWHKGQMARMSHDHTKMQMLIDAGMLTAEQARIHPQRNLVTRSLGLRDMDEKRAASLIVRPMPLLNGDRYLICSDGVSDLITDVQINDALTRGHDAQECATLLWNLVQSNGPADNATLIVLEMEMDQDPVQPYHIAAPVPEQVKLTEKSVSVSSENPDQLVFTQAYTITTPGGAEFRIKTEISGAGIDLDSFPGINIMIKPAHDK